MSEHFRSRHWRRRKERAAVAKALEGRRPPDGPRWEVALTRVGPSQLDGHDNLRSAFKAFADEISSWIGVDDRSPLVRWDYGQEVRRERLPLATKVRLKRTWRVWARLEIRTLHPPCITMAEPRGGGARCGG